MFFTYKVKIINPKRKSDAVRLNFTTSTLKFSSVISVHATLIEELKEQVPDTVTFKVGYFEGQQHSKMLIATSDDLKAMYSKYPKGEITLWCEGRGEESGRAPKRKREEHTATEYSEREAEVDGIHKDLKEKHEDRYGMSKLRLWARMIASNLHESLEDPPNIPAFRADNVKRAKQQPPEGNNTSPSVIPQEKLVNIRMKNYEQLRYLK